ncbi:MAG TPA: hypothetical protein VMY42_07265 [Thermoguttaceae bacterium]|nr:hypothetical protein [Thermoguttaceae bacterium]
MNRYLLPCSCGRKIPIEVGQAGQTARCECGAPLKVPTMLEMAALEKLDSESPPVKSTAWGIRQGLALLGIVMVLASLVLAVIAYRSRPGTPSAELIRERCQEFSPVESLRYWHELRDDGPDPFSRREKEQHADVGRRFHLWVTVTLVVAAGGIVLVASALFGGKVYRGKKGGLPPRSGD